MHFLRCSQTLFSKMSIPPPAFSTPTTSYFLISYMQYHQNTVCWTGQRCYNGWHPTISKDPHAQLLTGWRGTSSTMETIWHPAHFHALAGPLSLGQKGPTNDSSNWVTCNPSSSQFPASNNCSLSFSAATCANLVTACIMMSNE